MSASRLLLEHPFLRVSQLSPRKFTAFTLPSSIRLRRYCTTVSLVATQHDASVAPLHPWPEWVNLVDRLRDKGFFTANQDAVDENAVYTDKNLLKDASLTFARQRFDIFSSLSKEDIKNVVDKGCPNLQRKSVNSAKRLRAYLELDEREVCSSCDLRSSCNRIYAKPEDDTPPRTVDVVRILLAYALDPQFISGEKGSPGRELIEPSAKKLLSQLIELDETPLDPDFPKPIAVVKKKPSRDSKVVVMNEEWECAKCNVKNSSGDFQCQSCGWNIEGADQCDGQMKEGDWICTRCNFLNFSRNVICFKCKLEVPKSVSGDAGEMRKGDWNCPECNFMNFARNVRCFQCKREGPERVSFDPIEMKKGDWNCPQCTFMNFASNKNCFRCHQPRPPRLLRPGDWECPSCDALNFASKRHCFRCRKPVPQMLLKPGDWECPRCEFANFSRNTVCKRCSFDRPSDSEDQQDTWKRPTTQGQLAMEQQ